jgi:hypothetical protein
MPTEFEKLKADLEQTFAATHKIVIDNRDKFNSGKPYLNKDFEQGMKKSFELMDKALVLANADPKLQGEFIRLVGNSGLVKSLNVALASDTGAAADSGVWATFETDMLNGAAAKASSAVGGRRSEDPQSKKLYDVAKDVLDDYATRGASFDEAVASYGLMKSLYENRNSKTLSTAVTKAAENLVKLDAKHDVEFDKKLYEQQLEEKTGFEWLEHKLTSTMGSRSQDYDKTHSSGRTSTGGMHK